MGAQKLFITGLSLIICIFDVILLYVFRSLSLLLYMYVESTLFLLRSLLYFHTVIPLILHDAFLPQKYCHVSTALLHAALSFSAYYLLLSFTLLSSHLFA